ncbi:MAG TPA: hypothetical protein VFY29_08695 [Terriglobia bacterium]|nr:hypothetical protein [Terriglobia bacterium]
MSSLRAAVDSGLLFDIMFPLLCVAYAVTPVALAACPNILRIGKSRLVVAAVGFSAAVAVAQYVWWTVQYLALPVYFDHAEPTVAVMSALTLQGRQIYPSWQGGEGIYGTVYGPALLLIQAGALLVGRSILATKIAGVVASWAALLVWSIEVWHLTRDFLLTYVGVGLAFLFLLPQGYFVYWNRPEPFLLLVTALSLPALRLPRFQAAVASGVLAGIAFGLKPYAVLLLAPVMLRLALRETSVGEALRIGALSTLSMLVLAGAPFLLPNVSLWGYIARLKIVAQQGLLLPGLRTNMMLLTAMIAPAAAIYFFRRPRWSREIKGYALALMASIVVVGVFGAKNGAGSYYLLPFLPLAIHLAIEAADMTRHRDARATTLRGTAVWLFVAYLCFWGPFALAQNSAMNRALANTSDAGMAIRELDEIYADYPQAEMGVSDLANYRWTYYRVVGALRGSDVRFEVPFLMDLRAAGVEDAGTTRLVEGCHVPQWILPAHGSPFAIVSLFEPVSPIFTDRFRRVFAENYRIVFRGRYYTVWSC